MVAERGQVPQTVRRKQVLCRRLRTQADAEVIEQNDLDSLRPADTIYGCLVANMKAAPEAPAIVQVEPPDLFSPARTLTYADVVADVERSACLFHDLSGGGDGVVAIMLPMVPEGLTALWGAATSGVGVPINPFLERIPLVGLLREVNATILVATRDAVEKKCGSTRALIDEVPTLRKILYVDASDHSYDFRSALEPYSGFGLAFDVDDDPDRTAMVMPTGGTTGVPKLVRMSQRGQLTVAWNVGALMGGERSAVVGHGMPNFHCGGTISLGLRALLFGSTLLTLTIAGFRSPEVIASFWDLARHYRITSLLATPTTALALLHADGDSTGHCLADFHVGGSTLPMDLVQAFHQRFNIWLRENWGMTEIHGTVTGHLNNGTCPRVGSAGQALPGYRVRAVELDTEGNYIRDCAPGERGSLLIGGPSVTEGYLSPRHDAEFFPKGLTDGMRWGNSGDFGSVDEDGYVWVFGRAKDLIIRGGHNIDPRQIEDALAQHPAVHIAAAVGRPDAQKGELPIAYLQLRAGTRATPQELIDFCREHVQERAAVPAEIVILDQIPVTAVGKVSKPELRADAIKRAVLAQLTAVVPKSAEYELSLDNSGPRQCVVVAFHGPVGDDVVNVVKRHLVGYEFTNRVETG